MFFIIHILLFTNIYKHLQIFKKCVILSTFGMKIHLGIANLLIVYLIAVIIINSFNIKYVGRSNTDSDTITMQNSTFCNICNINDASYGPSIVAIIIGIIICISLMSLLDTEINDLVYVTMVLLGSGGLVINIIIQMIILVHRPAKENPLCEHSFSSFHIDGCDTSQVSMLITSIILNGMGVIIIGIIIAGFILFGVGCLLFGIVCSILQWFNMLYTNICCPKSKQPIVNTLPINTHIPCRLDTLPSYNSYNNIDSLTNNLADNLADNLANNLPPPPEYNTLYSIPIANPKHNNICVTTV